MVWSDIHKYSDISTELEHIVQLERTNLKYIPIMILSSYLHSVTLAYITGQSYVDAPLLHNVIYERGGSSLAIRPSDTDSLALAVALCKL